MKKRFAITRFVCGVLLGAVNCKILKQWCKSLLFIFGCLLGNVLASQATIDQAGKDNIESLGVVIVDAYMPQVAPVSNSAAIYLKIENHSKQPIQISAISSPAAKHLMMHQSMEVKGVAKMRHLKLLNIAAGKSATFAPGGLHIMMMGLQRDKMGSSFPLTLLVNGQEILVSVQVKPKAVNN